MERKSIMWNYINEATSVLKNLLLEKDIEKVANRINKEVESIYFVCHGSSYNAATVVSNFMASYANVRVYNYLPGNFLHNCTTINFENRSKTLVVAISQTGTSRGTIEAAQRAKTLGFPLLGITDRVDSPLYNLSDIPLPLHCGEENSNAKTKGYSSTLAILLQFTVELALRKGTIDTQQAKPIFEELKSSVDELPTIIEKTLEWCKETYFGRGIENVFVLGSGMNFGTALEGQLKLMETMCMPTLFNDIEEFSHGMHRAINQNSTVIILNSEDNNSELMEKTFHYLKTKTDSVIMINAREKQVDHPMVINIKNHPLTQSVLGITLIVQILSAFIPEINGYDPNMDANNDYTEYMKTRIS